MSIPQSALDLLSPLRAIALQTQNHPGKRAIDDGTGSTSYAKLWDHSAAIAEAVAAAGVQVGCRVAFALDPSAHYVAALLGTMLAGGTAVPLNTRLTREELSEFLDPIDPSFAIVSEDRVDWIPATRRRRLGAGSVLLDLDSRAIPRGTPFTDERREALILGTGGTTGLPKGAVFSHRSLWLWTASATAHANVRPTDVELFFSPFFHGTLVTGLLTTMTVGGTLLIPDRVDPEEVANIVATGRITRMLGTPTVFERIIHAARSLDMSASRLRLLQFGMGRSRPGLTTDLLTLLPSVALMTGYGATECGPVTRTYSWEFDDAQEPIGVGKPVAGADIRIDVDGSFGHNGVGEIVVNAPWQMENYCTRDTTTADCFTGGYFRTGDIGRFDGDGNLLLTGRIKETIRTGGENVYPSEVERWLALDPSIAECAVYGVTDAEWGERVEAAVVIRADQNFDPDRVDAVLRRQLAGYKIPKRYRVLENLPLTSNYKIDRRALRAAAEHAGAHNE